MCEDIEEIIFCHTSSGLSAGEDQQLRNICQAKNVLFDIYGIDRIADEIYRHYKILAKDHLGLSIDTGQVMEIEDFIERHDADEMAVPFSTVFQFREDEFTDLINRLSTHKVVVVIGHPSVGKTRISIEAAKRYAGEKKCRVLCIRSLHIPILEDLAS